jgi:hypothetical protein
MKGKRIFWVFFSLLASLSLVYVAWAASGDLQTLTIQSTGEEAYRVTNTGGIVASGTPNFTNGVVRRDQITGTSLIFDSMYPPTLTPNYGMHDFAQVKKVSFDADGGSTGDDVVYAAWKVPNGYIKDTATLNIDWSYSVPENNSAAVNFEICVRSAAVTATSSSSAPDGEAWRTATTAFGEKTIYLVSGSNPDEMYRTSFDIELVDIEVNDMVLIKQWVDESASSLANSGKVDVFNYEVEYETTY